MKIILTKRFQDKYQQKYDRYFSKADLVKVLQHKVHRHIPFHDPFVKWKVDLNRVAFRGVLAIETGIIIPLFIAFKKDKKYGENINWKDDKERIESEYEFAVQDIKKGEYEEY